MEPDWSSQIITTYLIGQFRPIQKEKKWHKGPLAIGYGSLLWCNVGKTSAGAKASHLHDNNNNTDTCLWSRHWTDCCWITVFQQDLIVLLNKRLSKFDSFRHHLLVDTFDGVKVVSCILNENGNSKPMTHSGSVLAPVAWGSCANCAWSLQEEFQLMKHLSI